MNVYWLHHNQMTIPVVSQVNTIRVQTGDDLKYQVLSQNFGNGVITHKKVYHTWKEKTSIDAFDAVTQT